MKATRIFCKLLLVCLVLSLTGCTKAPTSTEKAIFAMDTYMTFRAYGDNGEPALTEVIGTINAAAQELDPELEKSTVFAMNHAQGEPVAVSPLIYDMLAVSYRVYSQTGGALDPTIYPVVKAWGFIDQQYTVPDADTMAGLMDIPCFDNILLKSGPDGCAVTMPAGTQLSFGACAKGAIAEASAQILKNNGITSAFMSLGGNVQTVGLKPDGSQWRIGVEDPKNTGSYLGIVTVGESAVVTSGSYQRFFEADGQLYHHIIDPATCAPARSGLVSVTILCPSGTMADCLSTAMFILGEEAALEYQAKYGGFEMVLVTEDDRVIVTEGVTFEESAQGYTYEYVN